MHYSRLPIKTGCAFSEIGIDMAGPFMVKHGKTRAVGKRFVILFSCCWTRALSLEIMDDASTESCIMAFLRHSNTYGFPRYVNSDRGTNLIGADRHLREQWAVVEKNWQPRVLSGLQSSGISTPPTLPGSPATSK